MEDEPDERRWGGMALATTNACSFPSGRCLLEHSSFLSSVGALQPPNALAASLGNNNASKTLPLNRVCETTARYGLALVVVKTGGAVRRAHITLLSHPSQESRFLACKPTSRVSISSPSLPRAIDATTSVALAFCLVRHRPSSHSSPFGTRKSQELRHPASKPRNLL